MRQATFECGCSFPVLENQGDILKLPDRVSRVYQQAGIKPSPEKVHIWWDIIETPANCSATWELLSKGLTIDVFQLESPLGRQWCKKLAPEDLEHMGALGAILRPGCLKATDEDGVSMTAHYCLRKNGKEEVTYAHEALRPILSKTYGVLCYQEQSMQIAVALAGFNLQEADNLRKAIGKKLPEVMAKCKKMFIDGAKQKNIVTEEMAAQIWEWIEKSQRYAFNKSHAIRYGINGYHCAYAKAHFPLVSFKSFLEAARNSGDTYESIKNLVLEAKLFNIEVKPPRLADLSENFYILGNDVHFGLVDIKGIGNSHIAHLKSVAEEATQRLQKPLSKFTWVEFLTEIAIHCGESIVTRLIKAGTLPYNIHRQQMLAEYDTVNSLTAKEQEFVAGKKFNNVIELMKAVAPVRKKGGGAHTEKRSSAIYSYIQMLEEPPTQMVDSPGYIAALEEELLGISLTNHAIEEYDLSVANTTCKEFLSGKTGYMTFGVEISALREYTIKKGKNEGMKMAFLTIQDKSCVLSDVCAFSDVYEQYQELLKEGNVVLLQCERDKKRDSLIIKKVWKVK